MLYCSMFWLICKDRWDYCKIIEFCYLWKISKYFCEFMLLKQICSWKVTSAYISQKIKTHKRAVANWAMFISPEKSAPCGLFNIEKVMKCLKWLKAIQISLDNWLHETMYIKLPCVLPYFQVLASRRRIYCCIALCGKFLSWKLWHLMLNLHSEWK